MNPNVVAEIVSRQTERNMPLDEQVVSKRTREAINRIAEQGKSDAVRIGGFALVGEQVLVEDAQSYQEYLSRLEDEVAVRDEVAMRLGSEGYDVQEIFSEVIDADVQSAWTYVGLVVQL